MFGHCLYCGINALCISRNSSSSVVAWYNMSALKVALTQLYVCYYPSHTGWAKKSKPDNFCNNFVYCQPISVIFGTYTL